MKSAIVIPARYGSSRFPGKPLATIGGKTMLERTWQIASAAGADFVLVATDDSRIATVATDFGAKVINTRSDCANGTERVYEALNTLGECPDIVVNLQGDAVLTPPWVLTELMRVMRNDRCVRIATPAVRLTLQQYQELANQKASGIVGGTFVVFDKHHNALYFSKAPIPFVRSKDSKDLPIFRHIGLYAYTRETLKEYLQLPATPLELTEGLEQLRALENGIPIRVVEVDYRGRTHWSVDSPTDVERVEAIIAAEGELCAAENGAGS